MFGSSYNDNNYFLWKSQIFLNKSYAKKIEELYGEIDKLNDEIEKLRKIILTLI